jgi:hypothetical protein
MACRIFLPLLFLVALGVVPTSTHVSVSPHGGDANNNNCGTAKTSAKSKWALQIICDAASLARSTPASDRLWAKNKCMKIIEMLEENGN